MLREDQVKADMAPRITEVAPAACPLHIVKVRRFELRLEVWSTAAVRLEWTALVLALLYELDLRESHTK